MSNPLYFSLAALMALLLIALGLVYPQGLGARSPAPFGHKLGPVWVPKTPPAHQIRDAL
jgi:hypothetical protein